MATIIYLAVCAVAAVVCIIVGCYVLVFALQLAAVLISLFFQTIIALAGAFNSAVCFIGRLLLWPLRIIVRKVTRHDVS